MSSISQPTLSVIIPVYNGGAKFRMCLQSLAASVSAPLETIVVSDGDSDGSWQVAEEFGAKVLRIPTRQGPAHARNLGARAAKGDILFFFDADVTIPQDAISSIAATFHRSPDLAALFGSYDEAPFERNFLSQYKNLFHHYVHQTAKEEASTFWSGCGAIGRKVFLAMDGFDEGYRGPAVEDIDLGYRLKRAGYRIRLVKELQVKHLKRWGAFSLLKADFLHRALPWTNLILNEGHFIDDLNLKLSDRLSVVCTFLFLFTLAGAWWMPRLFIIAGLCLMGLLLINRDLYRFFFKMRGPIFTIKAIPWHWAYFFYSGLAFAIGFTRHWLKKICC